MGQLPPPNPSRKGRRVVNDMPKISPLSNKKRRSDRDLHIYQLSLDGYCQQQIGKAYKMPASRVAQIFNEQKINRLKERISELKSQVEQAVIYVSEMHKARENMSLVEIVVNSGSVKARQEYDNLLNNAISKLL
jgi:SMC interacting uncharacterized protein involved in chromosome segregation